MADKKSELAEIARFGGKPQPNSGRGAHKKGDAVIDAFLVDVKEYEKSYSVSVTNWAKICSDAAKQRLLPALNIVLGKAGSPRQRVWVISNDSMMDYIRLLGDERERQMLEMPED